jgi:hypothetical protein
MGHAVETFRSMESLAQLQLVTALVQTRERLPIAQARGLDTDLRAFSTYDLLARHYIGHGALDLGVEAFREMLKLWPIVQPRFRPADVPEAEYVKGLEEQYTRRREQLQRGEAELKERLNRLEIATEGRPPAQRIAAAVQLGLPGEALSEVQRALQTGDREQIEGLNLGQVLNLMIDVGRADEARDILLSPQYNPVASLPPDQQPLFRDLHLKAAAAVGDFTRAREELAEVAARIGPGRQQSTAQSAAIIVGLAVAVDPVAAAVPARMAAAPVWLSATQEPVRFVAQEFELRTWAGLLALQEGDNAAALRAFELALRAVPVGFRVRTQEVAEEYRRLLAEHLK